MMEKPSFCNFFPTLNDYYYSTCSRIALNFDDKLVNQILISFPLKNCSPQNI